ncbi:acetolactate synthase [Bacteroidales bacterium OttesenSCG-928-L03]|nr:acetolactate synthase [Bacteroidales bacterium OttesenSCG-928-L03]
MTIHQISIFLENKYGKLTQVLGLLAEANIRIIAATVADTSEFGIMRMIVDAPQTAYQKLKDSNVSVNLTDVLAITTSSDAGAFAETIAHFTNAGLSIEYMYCISINGKSVLIIRTNNREGAREVIRRQNLGYLTEDDLAKLI